ncbi:MAG: prolyl oligopeptidase family serine peptidase [Candidatus Limnocylindrales bacterium]
MADRTVAPYGSWRSSITIDALLAERIFASEVRFDGDAICWLEERPGEAGRGVVVRATRDGGFDELTPRGVNVRDDVHEYGGGAWAIHGGVVYYSDFADGRLYRTLPGRSGADGPRAEPITPEGPLRYADISVDVARGRLICVREDHRAEGVPVNEIVAVPLGPAGGDPAEAVVLVSGADFYGPVRLSPDGHSLAWLTWALPDMPWDGSELRLADLDAAGIPGAARTIAGSRAESIAEPAWSPDGRLHFVSDRSDWWNIQRLEADGTITALAPMEAESSGPQWVFGLASYGFLTDGSIVAAVTSGGQDRLLHISAGRAPAEIPTPYTEISHVAAAGRTVALVASSPTEPAHVARLDVDTGRLTVLRRTSATAFPAAEVSVPRHIAFPTKGGLTAHALYYAPHNDGFAGPAGELPPLRVLSHGGPTASTGAGFRGAIQYFASRGMAVVDVDYGGSTGYGRAYRSRLDGQWGVVDVDDCIAAARYLIAQGEVDPERVGVQGGSAGGYTTLAALAFSDFFKAGVSYFGIGDLTGFDMETHKFESRYTERLVGPWPEARELWIERSPILHVERMNAPMLILQGLDDHVVPPSQAEQIVAALEKKGIPYAYLAFAGEGHGFRKSENIRRTYEAELSFYGQVFGFEPADEIEPLQLSRPA